MMENNGYTKTARSGVSLSTFIFLIFLVLKILGDTGTINAVPWLSWFWVFFPLWILPAVALGIAIIVLIVGVICTIIAEVI